MGSKHLRTDLLLDALSDGVCIAERNGEIVYLNPAARRMLDVPAETRRPLNACELLCGKLFAEGSDSVAAHCPLRDAAPHQSVVEFAGRHGPHEGLEWRDAHVRKAQRWRHLRVRCLVFTGGFWTLPAEERHFILIEDVSLAAQLEEQKEDWRRMVAHDIRSPLTNVLGTLLILAEVPAGRPLGPKEAELARITVGSCRRMLELLNLFLDVEELDQGAMRARLEPVALLPLVRAAELELASRVADRHVVVETDVDPSLRAVADEELLARVVQNVLDNAVKFSPAGGHVRVRAGHGAAGRAALSVQDQGPGIPTADLPFVFDRFYQAEARRAGRTQGNGLGLTFCKQALALMSGEIEARSRPGEGAEFTLTLPEAPGEAPAGRTGP